MSFDFFSGVMIEKKYTHIENENAMSFDPDKRMSVNEYPSSDWKSEIPFDIDKRMVKTEIECDTVPEKIVCRNEELAGKKHPDTDVPFERKLVQVDGKLYEVVVPKFDSAFDAQLPMDKLKETDAKQSEVCNAQLKQAVDSNQELREKFNDDQLEQIENGDTPDGYTWHHDAEVGKMQLVDTEIHQKTGHTGGRKIWGSGTDNR